MNCLVSGKVQGVWFRQATLEQAQALGIDGWVRNLPDGRVEVLAHGVEGLLAELQEWLEQGPELAQVADLVCVLVEESPPAGFHIRRD